MALLQPKQNSIQISEEVGVSQPTVTRVLDRWRTSQDIENQEGRGKAKLISEEEEELIFEKQLEDRRKPLAVIRREMIDEGHDLSYFQIWSVIQGNFHSTYMPCKIHLAEAHKAKRLS